MQSCKEAANFMHPASTHGHESDMSKKLAVAQGKLDKYKAEVAAAHKGLEEQQAAAQQPSAKRQKVKQGPSLKTLCNSSFLKLYAAAPRKPTAQNCLLALGSSPDFENVVSALSALPVAQPQALDAYVVKLWAILKGRDKEKDGKDFYKLLNDAVIADDEARLRLMMPIARLLTNILVSYYPSTGLVTWRGSQMSLEHLGEMYVGADYRVAMFVASSLDFEVAERFVHFEANRVIVELNIPQECNNAGFLGVEFFPEQEREYLMPPYTAVQVLGKRRHKSIFGVQYWILSLRVHKDNMEAPASLESILL